MFSDDLTHDYHIVAHFMYVAHNHLQNIRRLDIYTTAPFQVRLMDCPTMSFLIGRLSQEQETTFRALMATGQDTSSPLAPQDLRPAMPKGQIPNRGNLGQGSQKPSSAANGAVGRPNGQMVVLRSTGRTFQPGKLAGEIEGRQGRTHAWSWPDGGSNGHPWPSGWIPASHPCGSVWPSSRTTGSSNRGDRQSPAP